MGLRVKYRFSFFEPWLKGTYQMPDFLDLTQALPNLNEGVWLGINRCMALHQVNDNDLFVFDDAWRDYNNYYRKAVRMALDYKPGNTLDHEDRYNILRRLGPPPPVCYPIYIITCRQGEKEELIYIGKTASKHSRFAGGHSAALKLHDPRYKDCEKLIYQAQVMTFNTRHAYLPLELIGDKHTGDKILNDVESILIFYYQPELNSKKKENCCAENDFTIHIQNFGSEGRFLKDEVIFPGVICNDIKKYF